LSTEKKELLNMLRVMWRKGDSPLRRIYPSWEELEANVDILVKAPKPKPVHVYRSCPNCGVTQKITKPLDDLFPYEKCQSCKRPFHINNDLTIRKLTEEEKDDMPAEWVRIREELDKKKLAIIFRLE
jgi:hypothetical protein